VGKCQPDESFILLIHPYPDSKESSPRSLRGVFKTHFNILLHFIPRQSGWLFKLCG